MSANQWRREGSCHPDNIGGDPGEVTVLFFSDNISPKDLRLKIQGRAKRICGQCAVRSECLDYALDTNEPNGIWGGLTFEERKRLRSTTRQTG